MERIAIKALIAGSSLDGDLFDVRGRLLLAKGNDLTRDMLSSLLHSGNKFAYVGDWDPDEAEEVRPFRPVEEYRLEAAAVVEALAAELDRSVDSLESLDIVPTGKPLAASIDDSVQRFRTDGRVREWHAVCHEGVSVVKNIVHGHIDSEVAAEAAIALIAKVVDIFSKDRSLLTNLTNLRIASEYHYQHAFNTAVLAINIATAMGYNLEQVREVGIAALFQDLGMAMVPRDLVEVPRQLDSVEFIDIQKHTMLGLYVLERFKGLPPSSRLALYQHHERADGSGYTQRRERLWIHKFAQISAVADVYDALTSDRPWRKAQAPYLAMEHVIKQANRGRFNGEVIRGLLRYVSLFPIGSFVRLTTGEIGKVVHTNGDAFDRPVVSVLINPEGQRHPAPEMRNLFEEEEVRVERFVHAELKVDVAVGF
jgi:HD-GYP domain-containing protein (c-di-GMP phosphodiesterase class II)